MARLSQNEPVSRNATGDAPKRNAPNKVKSGCRTCKVRKVKCDEERPVCNRCASSGRICDGYGIWGGGNRIIDHSPTEPPLIPSEKIQISRKKGRLPRLTQPASSKNQTCVLQSIPTGLAIYIRPKQERTSNLLSWYHAHTAQKLSGLFPTGFWESLIPQASYAEPAVHHAALALTSAHRYENYETIPGQLSREEALILQDYSNAIYYLKPHFNLQDRASYRIILITCFLFTSLEMVQRHRDTAISHLINGLKLIERFEQTQGAIGTTNQDHVSDSITQMFFELLLQIKMLGYNCSHAIPVNNRHIPEKYPGRFSSVFEAKNCLHKITARVFDLSDQCRKQGCLQQAQCALKNYQSVLRADLESWLQNFTSSGLDVEVESTNPSLDKAACMIVRMHHAMTVIMIETCLSPDQETLFDCYWADFMSIITYALMTMKIVTALQSQVLGKIHQDGFIIGTGWIPALFYTATKCRVRRIRLHAIRIIEGTCHKESVWDAVAAAKTAREVMRIEEEGGQSMYTRIDEDFNIYNIPLQEELVFPTPWELQRVQNIDVTFPDKIRGRTKLVCQRRLSDDHYEDIRREYDPVSETWFNLGH